jgi:hypothetical protein
MFFNIGSTEKNFRSFEEYVPFQDICRSKNCMLNLTCHRLAAVAVQDQLVDWVHDG